MAAGRCEYYQEKAVVRSMVMGAPLDNQSKYVEVLRR